MDDIPAHHPPKPNNHHSYFAAATPEARARLRAIQAIVEETVVGAERCVSYGMPAFRLGKIFFYFSAFKKHIGMYPPVKGPADLVAELATYRGPKGNLIFPHDKELPLELIGRVAHALADYYGRKTG